MSEVWCTAVIVEPWFRYGALVTQSGLTRNHRSGEAGKHAMWKDRRKERYDEGGMVV